MTDKLPGDESRPPLSLAEISTRWSSLGDPVQFVMRYSPAIRAYLLELIRQPQDAEDVAQEFLLRFVERGLPRATPDRGRFRDYLKVAVRNSALTYYRRKRPAEVGLDQVAELPDHRESEADARWLTDWRQCLLDMVWRRLDSHQRRNPGNLAHLVLRTWLDHPDLESPELAGRVQTLSGQPLSPVAFRKQLSRARRLFAEFLLEAVTQTLSGPAELVEEELAELGLLELLRQYMD